MTNVTMPKWMIAGAAGLTLLAFGPANAFADSSPPKPKIDCKKKANKSKPECKNQHRDSSMDEELYARGYELAMAGKHTAALDQFYAAKNQADPRILTMIGYSTRKLGRIDAAMGYYFKALAANPGLTNTRQYLGEAYLQKGEPLMAKEQLAEIGKRCGTTCEDYRKLSLAIADFEKSAS